MVDYKRARNEHSDDNSRKALMREQRSAPQSLKRVHDGVCDNSSPTATRAAPAIRSKGARDSLLVATRASIPLRPTRTDEKHTQIVSDGASGDLLRAIHQGRALRPTRTDEKYMPVIFDTPPMTTKQAAAGA